jgi:AraC-type transcriptional regulator N-terminus
VWLGESTVEFLNVCCRLVDLLRKPHDIPFLSGLIQREIICRILGNTVPVKNSTLAVKP